MDYQGTNTNVQKPIEVYIHGISGMRFLGIFGVIFYHMFPYTVKGGFLGVNLFFIISGYLLAVKSEEQRRVKKFSVGDFYVKRVKRLYPQLIVVLLSVCGVLSFLMPSVLKGIKSELLSIIFGYNNIWQIAQNASYFERMANTSPFTHMWSLANEIQVYLIWPLIFFGFIYLIKRLDTKKALTAMLVLALLTSLIMPVLYDPNADVTRLYYGTDTRIFSFLTGAYIGFRRTRYKMGPRIKNEKPYIVGFVALLVGVIISYFFMDGQGAFTYLGGMFIANLGFALMLLLVTNQQLPIGNFLDNKVLTFFGDVSYEMYLWMYPVIFIFHGLRIHNSWWAPFAMLAIIVFLARWLNYFARILVTRKFTFGENLKKKALSSGAVLVSLCMVVMVCIGGYSAVTAQSKDKAGMVELEKQLAENAKILQAQREETKKIKDTEAKEKIEENKPVIEKQDRTITAVGDSVMLGAALALQEVFPGCVVDAKESRQAYRTMPILEELNANGAIGNTVLIALGTNGIFTESVGQELIDYVGPDKEIYWINIYAPTVQWMDETNAIINTLAQKNDNVQVIDWASEGPNHPEWFYDDSIHLRPEGQEGYAKFVESVIGTTMEVEVSKEDAKEKESKE